MITTPDGSWQWWEWEDGESGDLWSLRVKCIIFENVGEELIKFKNSEIVISPCISKMNKFNGKYRNETRNLKIG